MAVRAETFAEGEPCGADAMLSDVEAGKRFYGGLFGTYVWSELYARDTSAEDAVYADVFGHGMRDLGDLADRDSAPDFAMWAAAGDPVDHDHAIGGRRVIEGAYPAEMPAHFLTYFAVDDCDAAAHTTVRLGGRVRHEPEETPHGRYAVLIDDQGATFAVPRVPQAASARAA